mmetsp:Transcript_15068/g.42522  ORF Transcript_15068/g.42522 Transcript_15068/m.42522 type:complete len:223 (-) Transcript_15068:59-727(-)|eukprot:CAMPEP_0119562484 /NCGR_PEP_ID=MMETSP1352-20130426/20598_1 /TAXON_ID=265584 /ORGANISM="Stauroneis constricta, Strain CCMP1120" /LENGTH=222 /DNA_ID=CAMNT_0007610899 /DNA_START=89 /DNA_END=757 /DNA_ORIENTATION=+
MSNEKAFEALKKTKEAIIGIKRKLRPVVERLNAADANGNAARGSPGVRAQAQATVALSLGMMRFMGARIRGLDQGRKPDDPLRQELNKVRKLLAEIKGKNEKESKSKSIKDDENKNGNDDKKNENDNDDGPQRKKARVLSSSAPSSASGVNNDAQNSQSHSKPASQISNVATKTTDGSLSSKKQQTATTKNYAKHNNKNTPSPKKSTEKRKGKRSSSKKKRR